MRTRYLLINEGAFKLLNTKPEGSPLRKSGKKIV